MPSDRAAGPLSLPAYRVYWPSRLVATLAASNRIGECESGVVAAWPVPAVVLGRLDTLVVMAAWIGLFPVLARRDRLHPTSEDNPGAR